MKRKILQNEQGASTVEFAICAVVLFTIIFGIIVVVCSLRNRDRLWAAGLSVAGLGPLLFVLINWVTLFCELLLAH